MNKTQDHPLELICHEKSSGCVQTKSQTIELWPMYMKIGEWSLPIRMRKTRIEEQKWKHKGPIEGRQVKCLKLMREIAREIEIPTLGNMGMKQLFSNQTAQHKNVKKPAASIVLLSLCIPIVDLPKLLTPHTLDALQTFLHWVIILTDKV